MSGHHEPQLTCNFCLLGEASTAVGDENQRSPSPTMSEYNLSSSGEHGNMLDEVDLSQDEEDSLAPASNLFLPSHPPLTPSGPSGLPDGNITPTPGSTAGRSHPPLTPSGPSGLVDGNLTPITGSAAGPPLTPSGPSGLPDLTSHHSHTTHTHTHTQTHSFVCPSHIYTTPPTAQRLR